MATVIDDSDPNLRWEGAPWITVHDAPSALIDRYYNRTMHASTNNGDFVEIKWNGADIAVYGARRDNHVGLLINYFTVEGFARAVLAKAQGVYGIILDSGAPQYFSGNANPSTFQQVLFATSGLAQGDHTLRVSNELSRNSPDQAGWIWFDFDFVAFNGVIKNANPGGSDPAPPPPAAPAPAPSSTSKPAPSSSIPPSSRPPPSAAPTLASSVSFILLPSSSSSPTSSSTSSSATSSISSSSAISTSASSSASKNTSQAVFSASAPITLPSGFSSVVQSSSVSGTSSGGVTRTDGQPSQPSGQGGDVPAEGSGQGTSSNKTTVVAVSSTVIALAVLVVATVVGIWWHRRRKRLRELDAMEEYHDGYVRPDSSWTRM